MKTSQREIQNHLTQIKKQWEPRYQPLIFEAQCRKKGQSLVVTAQVLTQKQRQFLISSLSAFPALDHEIQLLSEKAHRGLVGVEKITDVFSSPGPKKNLMSQILPQEGPCKLLDYPEVAGFCLVELPDKTLGWVQSSQLSETPPLPRPLWEYFLPASLKYLSSDQREEVFQTGRSLMGVPYKLGGRSSSGMDCSALVQAILRNSLGMLLPRHSGDQRKLGLRVTSQELRPGDLVFGRKRGRRIFHVAMVSRQNTLLHSCLDHGEVMEEPTEKFRKKYQVIGARRLFEYGRG